jgi:hypothetical protein
MARFGSIIMVYFVIGAVMWGGGAIAWEDSGVGSLVIQDPQTGEVNNELSSDLENTGGPLRQAAQGFGGAVLGIWNIVIKFVGYLFWPVTVLQSVNAPPRLVVLLGGTPTLAFLGSVLRLITRSA